MEVLNAFQVAAPAAETEIARAHQQMSIFAEEEGADFWMETPRRASDRFKLIVATRTAGAMLAQGRPYSLRIGQNRRAFASAAHQRVEQYRLHEGKAERISSEQRSIPRGGPNEIERRHDAAKRACIACFHLRASHAA